MKRRLTDLEFLLMARPDAQHPDLSLGDAVWVLYQFQDPQEAVVTGEPDRNGWVEVEVQYRGEGLRFKCLAACCVKRDEDV